MKLKSLFETKKKKLNEQMDKNVLFWVDKEKEMGETMGDNGYKVPLFMIQYCKPNTMPLKSLYQVPNKVCIQIEADLQKAVEQVFAKYSQYK